jgi:hypothetical protein
MLPSLTDQHNRTSKFTNLDYLIDTSNLYSAKPLSTMAGGSCLGPPQTGSISCHPSQATADLAPAFQAEFIRVSDMIQLKVTFVLEVWRFWKLLEGNGNHRTGFSKKIPIGIFHPSLASSLRQPNYILPLHIFRCWCHCFMPLQLLQFIRTPHLHLFLSTSSTSHES